MSNVPLAQHLKRIRQDSELTLDQLGTLSGISRASLSRIENGTVSPTAETLGALARVYALPISALLAPMDNAFEALIRQDAQKVWVDPQNGFTRVSVSPPSRALKMEVLRGQLSANQTIHYPSPTFAGHEHHLVMLDGELFLTLDGTEHHLLAGDCLRYKLSGSSRFTTGNSPASYLLALCHGE